MWKKSGAAAAALILCAGLCAGLTGCSGSKEYRELKTAQEAVAQLTSGRLLLTAGYEKPDSSDQIVTEFVFKLTDGGAYAYCQTQLDRSNKPVCCEYSDGQKTEQWLIGKGWSPENLPLYTPENPHRYLQVLSTPLDPRAVREITVTNEAGNRRYEVTLDPARLNKTVYTDEASELLEERVSLLLSETGMLLSYHDEALIQDQELDGEARYILEMQLSEPNLVSEVKRPELRGYGADSAAGAIGGPDGEASVSLDEGK